MTDAPDPVVSRSAAARDTHAATPGKQTSEFLVVLAQLAFAAFCLHLGEREVAMVALAASGLYPVSRAITKKG